MTDIQLPQNDASGNTRRLKVFSQLGETFRIAFAYPRALLTIIGAPIAITVLLNAVGVWLGLVGSFDKSNPLNTQPAFPGEMSGQMVGYMAFMAVVNVLLGAGVAIACHRLVLLGLVPSGWLGVHLGLRELKYVGYMALIGLLMLIPYLVVSFGAILIFSVIAGLSGGAEPIVAILMFIAILFAMIAAVLVMLRLSLIVPALAVDQPGSISSRIRESWNTSKGYALTMFADVFVLILALVFVSLVLFGVSYGIGMIVKSNMIWVFTNALVGYLDTALFAILISLFYRKLATATPPAGEADIA